MRSFTWISINRWILKEFNKLKKKKQKHNSLQKMTHSSKLRNSVSMPSINLLPLHINVLYSIFPFTSSSFRKKWRLHVEISVLSSLRIQQVKKKKRKRRAKRSSLQKLTHFFVRHSSFTFVLSREKRNMTLKLLPTDRSDTSTYDCPLNPESKSRKRGTAPNGNDANSRGGC